MTEPILNQGNDDPLQEAKAFMAQLMTHFGTIQQALEENAQLRQRVAALESENAALTETLEQWKNNDEWSNRVTYDSVVDQIASLEDASKRDDARRVFEPNGVRNGAEWRSEGGGKKMKKNLKKMVEKFGGLRISEVRRYVGTGVRRYGGMGVREMSERWGVMLKK